MNTDEYARVVSVLPRVAKWIAKWTVNLGYSARPGTGGASFPRRWYLSPDPQGHAGVGQSGILQNELLKGFRA